jgi:hypothetical protein
MSKILDPKKAQAILDAVKQSVAKLTIDSIEKIAETQADKLQALKFSLVYETDATRNAPLTSGQITYGGRKYKQPL